MSTEILGFRLSPQQKHLWLLQRDGYNAAYRVQCSVLIKGDLDHDILKQAIGSVVDRHEILRTVFHFVPGVNIPLQVVSDSSDFAYIEHDLSQLEVHQQSIEIEKLFDELNEAPIDCERMPALQVVLVKRSASETTLIIGLPAVCMDASGLIHAVIEIIRSYGACLQQTEVDGEPLQYADLSKWQNELLEGAETALGREYWRELDLESAAACKLPSVNGEQRAEFEPRYLSWSLPVREIEELAAREGWPVAAFLLSCWQVLLWRLTGAGTIEVGTAFNGRCYPELEAALGLFTRYLPLHTTLEEQQSLAEVVQATARMMEEAAEWQEYFSWEELSNGGRGREQAYFAFGFEYEELPESSAVGGLCWQMERLASCVERYQVKLHCQRREGLELQWHYDAAALSEGEVKRLAAQFATLVESACQRPEAGIGALEVVSAAERVQLLEEWNQTAVDYEVKGCLPQQFEAQVARTPEATAVVYEGTTLSYAELNRRANRVARHLRDLGIGAESRVGLLADRGLEMVVGLLGIGKAGAAYVPLDPGYPRARLDYMIADAAVSVLLTERRQQQLATEVVASVGTLLYLDDPWAATGSAANLEAGIVDPENLAYIIYTSGSTGQPKGVMNTHRGICNRLFWMQDAYRLTPGDRVLQKTPFSFDVSVWEFFWPLLTGARLVMAEPGGHQNPAYIRDLINQEQITVIHFVPTMLQIFLEEPGVQRCTSLRKVFCSGEALGFELQQKFFARFGAELHNLYGPTEAAVDVTHWKCNQNSARKVVPIGRPIANTQIHLLDRNCEPVPIGVAGELHIGGVNLARGYHANPGMTAEKFVPNAFSNESGARLYKTGDLARYLPDGNIEFLGRKDHQVKIRGYRIELEEIEVKLRTHAAVKDAAVLVREDNREHPRLVGYIVSAGAEATVNELRNHLSAALPDYMIPSSWVFLKALPVTPSGKLDKRALPAPDESRPELAKPYVKPRTKSEEVLANIWAEVLGIDQVGIYDNFFELGGDSILSFQTIAKANQANIRLTPRQLFQYQTIADLQSVIGLAPIVQAEQGIVTGPVPLTPIQHWFFDSAFADPHHFNQSFLFEVPSSIDPAVMEKAVASLLEHHDALRMRFTEDTQGWTQTNADVDQCVPFSRADLTWQAEAEQKSSLKTKAHELQRSLNLADGPLMRVALLDRGKEKTSWLLIIIHHLVVDGVSWRILLEDLQLSYEQLSRGEAVQLPAKTTSYKQWAEQLQKYAQTNEIEQETDYWEAERSAFNVPMPVDFPDGENLKSSARTVAVSFNEEETRQLLQEVPKVYRTQINDLLLTALLEAYRQWTGDQNLLIDLEGHGREAIFDDVDLSRTVGWFTTLYPVCLEMDDDGWERNLKTVKEHLRGIPGRGIGYGLLKNLSPREEIRARLRKGSEAEVNFNYLGQFDQTVSGPSLFRLASESSGEVYSPRAKRTYLLEINGIVVRGQLQLEWTYSDQIHRRESINTLAHSFMEALRSLVQHCLSQATPSFTPSDFAEFKWSQTHLDEITASIDQATQL